MKNKKTLLWACLICFICLAVFKMLKSEQTTPSKKTSRKTSIPSSKNTYEKSTDKPLEYRLAVINKGKYIPEDDITVVRFRYLLETLEDKTNNSKEQIADMSVAAVQRLREKYGRDISLLQFMEGMNTSIPVGSKVNYAEAAALYMQMLK